MTEQQRTYWEQVKMDPANYCPERGEYPPACQVELYEGSSVFSHIYGVCHGHRMYWHLQSGGRSSPDWPKLSELEGHYTLI